MSAPWIGTGARVKRSERRGGADADGAAPPQRRRPLRARGQLVLRTPPRSPPQATRRRGPAARRRGDLGHRQGRPLRI